MAEPELDATAVRAAIGLANVCRQLKELRQLLQDAAPLTQLVVAVRAREPDQVIADLLDELDEAVQTAGDMAGIFGFDMSRGDGVGLDTLEIVFRCPIRRCTGRADAGRLPLCEISPACLPLLRERL